MNGAESRWLPWVAERKMEEEEGEVEVQGSEGDGGRHETKQCTPAQQFSYKLAWRANSLGVSRMASRSMGESGV